MAEIEIRHYPKSNTTSYRVRWYDENGYRVPPYVFNTAPDKFGARAEACAKLFRSLVEAGGERLPTRRQLEAVGLAGILDQPAAPAAVAAAPQPVTDTAMTVAQMMTAYLDYRIALGIKVPSADTMKGYRGQLRNHIMDRPFGALDQATCGYRDADAWQADMLTRVSPNMLRIVRAGLAVPAFTWACSERSGTLRTRPSPFIDAILPEREDSEEKDSFEDPLQMAWFLRFAWELDPSAAALMTVAAVTGMRFQELAALTPADVQPFNNLLRVRSRVADGLVQRGLKNRKKERKVPVVEWVMRRIIIPRMVPGRAALFLGPRGNRWDDNTLRERYLAIEPRMADVGLPLHITSHCMRHTARGWLSSNHFNTAKIDAFLGHNKRTVGDGYDRLTVPDREAIRRIMEQLVPESTFPGVAAAPVPVVTAALPTLRAAAR